MKKILFIFSFFLFFTNYSLGQKELQSYSFNDRWNSLTMKSDSTFYFLTTSHHPADFVRGRWTITNDTVYFFPEILSDTIIVNHFFYKNNRLNRIFWKSSFWNTSFRKKPSKKKYIINRHWVYYMYDHVQSPCITTVYRNGKSIKYTRKMNLFETNHCPDSIAIEIDEKRYVIPFDKKEMKKAKGFVFSRKKQYLLNQYGLYFTVKYHTSDFMHLYFPNNMAIIVDGENGEDIHSIPIKEEQKVFKMPSSF